MPKKERLRCNGLGANVNIIGFIPNCRFEVEGSVQHIHVGVLEKGDFELLAGNDFLNKFGVIINTKNRSFSYEHPMFGRISIGFIEQKNVKPINFNK